MSTSVNRAERKRPYLRSQDRREQLLAAVGRLFDRSGFGGITMTGVATEAGVSRQLVYDHFDDLDTLCEAFVLHRLERYHQNLPAISTHSPHDAAAIMFRHLLTIPTTDRRVVRLLVADVAFTALDRVRERFRADELARWRPLEHTARRSPTAASSMWAATSALLALADDVSSGPISEADATTLAVAIVSAAASRAGSLTSS
jgi:AcrR family transcriptional regulator